MSGDDSHLSRRETGVDLLDLLKQLVLGSAGAEASPPVAPAAFSLPLGVLQNESDTKRRRCMALLASHRQK
jgi:hypothetical protein